VRSAYAQCGIRVAGYTRCHAEDENRPGVSRECGDSAAYLIRHECG
jgi:hypothetical protein